MKYFLIFLSFRTPDVSVTITSSDLAGVLQGTLSPLQVEMFTQLVCQFKNCSYLSRRTWPVESQLRATSRSWCSLTSSQAVVTNPDQCLTYDLFHSFLMLRGRYYIMNVTIMTFSIWDSKFPRFWISWVKCNYYRNADLATRQSKKANLCCNYQCLGTLVRTNAQCNNDEIIRCRNLYYCKHFDTTTYRADESCHRFGSNWTFNVNFCKKYLRDNLYFVIFQMYWCQNQRDRGGGWEMWYFSENLPITDCTPEWSSEDPTILDPWLLRQKQISFQMSQG